jgi:Fe-S-cluster containining protein
MIDETDILAGTRIGELIVQLDGVYRSIETAQCDWKRASPFQCASGCGQCCVDFEPDVLPVEATYLAVWMLRNQRERALSILDGTFVSPRPDPERGCPLFNPDNPYHCTVYGGRALICRLFAYTGDRGKDGTPRWKPCKFLPLQGTDGGLPRKRQYSGAELLERFGAVPPLMCDISAQAVAIDPDGARDRRPLREALRDAIRNALLVERFSSPPEPNTPAPDTPKPIAS